MRPPPPPPPPPPPIRRLARLLVLLLVAVAASYGLRSSLRQTPPGHPAPPPNSLPATPASLDPAVLDAFVALEQQEKTVSTQIWATEEAAQLWASRIETFWNRLNENRGRLAPLLEAPARSISFPPPDPPSALPHDIQAWHGSLHQPLERFSQGDPRFAAWLAEGWGLEQSEWRHVRFVPPSSSPLPVSLFEVHLHFTRPSPPARVQIAARLRIAWPDPEPRPNSDPVGDWEIEHWEMLRRDGEPAFREEARLEVPPFPRTTWIDPVIAVTPEDPDDPNRTFLLAARNLRVRRSPEGAWSATTLSPHHPGLIFTATLADFTGDGHPDLLCVVRGGLVLLPGSPGMPFDTPALPAWTAPERFAYAQALACGDIDHDGDLDVFVGQYRTPYESGQMPRPFYDALDGPPAYLLRNLGGGRFEDITAASGLAAKRHRRTYAASFADLDGDSDLDLLVTSDFAGVDLHVNDGLGRFTDRTADRLDDPRAFGMSHLLSDFDADGALDIFVAGMPQPTADRLSHLGLQRPGYEAWSAERSRMSVGNRIFFGDADRFHQRESGAQVARAGWAWSAADLDLDHDRFPELYVVNGHETRRSVRDYEREFWLHDIYAGDSTPRPAVDAYFASKFASTRAQGWSYGGYDKNRLFLNRGGHRFVEAAHLLGLALEADCRNVLADDFDLDGDADLLVTTFEVWPQPRQTLRLLENTLPRQGHWIEIQPKAAPGHGTAIGATVHLLDRQGRQVRHLALGTGYRSQGRGIARFGLGAVETVDQVDVRWPGGGTTTVKGLAVDRRHVLRATPPPP